MAQRKYSKNAAESEKSLERYLCELTKAAGVFPSNTTTPTPRAIPTGFSFSPTGR